MAAAERNGNPAGEPVIAYLVSRFPKITEVFILIEIEALSALGVHIELFSLVRENESVQHDGAARWESRAHFSRILSLPVLLSQIYWLSRKPATLLALWRKVLWEHRESRKFFIRAVAALLLAGRFAREMEAAGVQHIHCHWATHPALAAYAIHRLTGIPYSFTSHAHDLFVEQTMLRDKIAASSFVITISEYNRRFLVGLYGRVAEEKVRVLRSGVNTGVFRPGPKDRPAGRFSIVCIGALEEKKGHAYLIEACRLLAQQGLAFQCQLIGDGELREALQAQIQAAGLEDCVQLLGSQPRDRVSTLLSQADAVVQPSIRLASGKMEGIPMALMEALASEVPAVATDISGISELVIDGQTGLLVPERDPAAIAAALTRLAGDPALRQQLGAAGRQKVVADHDLTKNTQRLFEFLVQSVKESSSRRSAPVTQ